MQRTYSMFPPGAPGTGLVLLRLCLVTLLWPALNAAQFSTAGHIMSWCAIGIALALALGMLTPIACALCLVLASVEVFTPMFSQPIHVLPLALNAIALVLLGPGAYSADARLYGYRVLTLPSRK